MQPCLYIPAARICKRASDPPGRSADRRDTSAAKRGEDDSHLGIFPVVNAEGKLVLGEGDGADEPLGLELDADALVVEGADQEGHVLAPAGAQLRGDAPLLADGHHQPPHLVVASCMGPFERREKRSALGSARGGCRDRAGGIQFCFSVSCARIPRRVIRHYRTGIKLILVIVYLKCYLRFWNTCGLTWVLRVFYISIYI